jgi:hypothetical protein
VASEQLDAVPVYTLTGEWRTERLAELLPGEKEKIAAGQMVDSSKLPEQMPEKVVLKLGRDDFFPYRLEYWRRAALKDDDTPGALQAVVVMELYEVQINGAVDPRQFEFKPGDLDYIDQTKEYVRSHGIDPDAPVPDSAQKVRKVVR